MPSKLSSLCLDEEDVSTYRWPDLLQQVAFLFNASVGVSTGASPFEIMYGYKPELPLTLMRSSHEADAKVSPKTFVEELKNKLSDTWKSVGEKIEKEKEKRNEYYNRSTRDVSAEEGDYVYLKDHARSHSLSPKFGGPYRIIWRRGANVKVEIADKEKVVHLNNCKVIKSPGPTIFQAPLETTEAYNPVHANARQLVLPDEEQPIHQ